MISPLVLVGSTALVVFLILGFAEWYVEEDELDEPTLTRRVRIDGGRSAARRATARRKETTEPLPRVAGLKSRS